MGLTLRCVLLQGVDGIAAAGSARQQGATAESSAAAEVGRQ
jgi:hypothetical protein